jgi:hypothetical protein
MVGDGVFELGGPDVVAVELMPDIAISKGRLERKGSVVTELFRPERFRGESCAGAILLTPI